jgi:predicted Na+-dependent transporter
MHVFGASLDYASVAALLLSFVLARNPAWRPIRKRLFITASITLVVIAAFMVVLPYDGHGGPGVLAGLFGRFLMLSYLGWLLAVGFPAIKLRKAPEIEQRIAAGFAALGCAFTGQAGSNRSVQPPRR